jgi:Fe2+ transport system protein FeoA
MVIESIKSEDKAMYKWRQIMVIRPLSDLGEGENGKIVRIRGKIPMHRYLYEMGLAVGRDISIKKVETTSPDPSVTVIAGERTATLNRRLALNILVEVPLTVDERVIPDPARGYARLYQTIGSGR